MADPPPPSRRAPCRETPSREGWTRAGGEDGGDTVEEEFGVAGRTGRRGRRSAALIRQVGGRGTDDDAAVAGAGVPPDGDELELVEDAADEFPTRAVDDEVPATIRRAARRPQRDPRRVVWRISSAAALVLAAIAVVLVVRALVAPAAAEIRVQPVTAAASAGVVPPGSTPTSPAWTESSPGSSPRGQPSGSPATTGAFGAAGDTGAAAAGPTGQIRAVVHVTGAVRRPGVVRVAPGGRVADAVAAAGGPLSGARLDAINLAAPAQDGTQIHVPAAGEEATTPGPGSAAGPAPASPGVTGTGPGSVAAPVNINTADAAGLDALPRVGPVLAQRIVAWRTEHGPFGSVDDLDAVPGIGEKMMADLGPLVTTG